MTNDVIIGKLRINKPYKETLRFEVAAWWEEVESIKGVYDIVLFENQDKELWGKCIIDTVVTDDYFPTLFGGVTVGTTKRGKGIGEYRNLIKSWPLYEILDRTAYSQNMEGYDIYLTEDYWDSVLDEAKERVEHWAQYCQERVEVWASQQDDQFYSKLSQVGYAAENLNKWVRILQSAHRKIENNKGQFKEYMELNCNF